jgi:hypothetical protein
MREMTAEKAAGQIKRAYEVYRTQPGTNEWMMIADLQDRVDLTANEIKAGILHLNRTERQFTAIPESNQKVLTGRERAAAVMIGNQAKHLIGWV